MKKTIIIISAMLLSAAYCFSQGTAINATGAKADTSAILDLSSTSKGLRIPRVGLTDTSSAVTPVNNPAHGLLVFDTLTGPAGSGITPGFYYWDAAKTQWLQLATASASAGSSGGGLTGIITLTNTSGSTYTPTAGTKKILIRLIGGGGGGGGVSNQPANGGGGASGNFLEKFIDNFTGTATYQCGAGGAGSTGDGGTGGATTFTYGGTTYTANGGGGGKNGNAGVSKLTMGGSPGAISANGDINGVGNYGGQAFYNQDYFNIIYAGAGAASIIGAGAPAPTSYGGGINATNYGSGGSGTYCNSAPSGSGKQGIIIVYEYN